MESILKNLSLDSMLESLTRILESKVEFLDSNVGFLLKLLESKAESTLKSFKLLESKVGFGLESSNPLRFLTKLSPSTLSIL